MTNKLFNNKFEIVEEKEEDDFELYGCKLVHDWASWYSLVDDYSQDIFTEKAQRHILKELGVETKDRQPLTKVEGEFIYINNAEAVIESNKLRVVLNIVTYTGTIEYVHGECFTGKEKTTVIEFTPEQVGLVQLLPNCVLKGLSTKCVDYDLLYGLPEEKEELVKELLVELLK